MIEGINLFPCTYYVWIHMIIFSCVFLLRHRMYVRTTYVCMCIYNMGPFFTCTHSHEGKKSLFVCTVAHNLWPQTIKTTNLTCIASECTPTCKIIEGSVTAFNGFKYQFTTRKPLKTRKPTIKIYASECMLPRREYRHQMCTLHAYIPIITVPFMCIHTHTFLFEGIYVVTCWYECSFYEKINNFVTFVLVSHIRRFISVLR